MASPKNKRKSQGAGGASGSYSDVYRQSASQTTGPAATGAAVAVSANPVKEANLRASNDVDWRGEYGYVLADLRYLGIVTAIIVGAIIVVGIFL